MSSIKAYRDVITRVYPHNNANKLQLAEISGYQVVVGLDAKEGDEGILFLPDAILTPVVIEYFGLNYLSKGRVKVTKLRGEWSDALFVTCTEDDLEVLGGIGNMWKEYVSPQRKRSKTVSAMAKKQDTLNKVFPKHMDTQQYLANRKQIEKLLEDGWEISYSIKTHGTCLVGGTKIKMSDGSTKLIKHIGIGDEVKTKDGIAIVVATHKYPNKHNWVKLSVAQNEYLNRVHSITCTEDHLIFTDRGWVEAQHLTTNDLIMVGGKSYINPTQTQRDFHEGKLWGDGYMNKHLSLEYSHKEDHLDYVNYCRLGFGNLHKSENIKTSGFGTAMLRSLNKVSKFLPAKPSYLNDRVIAIWYMDDGSLSHTDYQEDRANLAVCRYTWDECVNIVKLFNSEGLYPKLYTDKEGYNRLRFNKDTAETLFSKIAKHVPPIMQYKLPTKYREMFVPITYQEGKEKDYFCYTTLHSIQPTVVKSSRYDLSTTTSSFIAQGIVVHNSGRSSKLKLPMEPSSTEKTLLKYSYYLGLYSWYSNYLERKYENRVSTIYTPIFGSRNVVFKPTLTGEVNKDFRKEVHSLFEDKLYEDECIYYEILGYDDVGKPIMEPYKGQPYDYGIPKGEWGIQVYRITQDGRELSPWQLEPRCNELNVMPVHTLSANSVEEAFTKSLTEIVCFTTTSTKPVSITNYTHTNEGLVIRLDRDGEIKLFKHKNREFLLQEGILPPQVDGESNEQIQQEKA